MTTNSNTSHLNSQLKVEIAIRTDGIDDTPSVIRVSCLPFQCELPDPMGIAHLRTMSKLSRPNRYDVHVMLMSTHPLGTISVHLHPSDPLLEHAAEVRLVIILIPGRRLVRGCEEFRIVLAVQERT